MADENDLLMEQEIGDFLRQVIHNKEDWYKEIDIDRINGSTFKCYLCNRIFLCTDLVDGSWYPSLANHGRQHYQQLIKMKAFL